MSDNDDYLSAKFLVNPAEITTTPKTYSQLRKEASKKSQEKNASNQRKSRRQRELESREEGLNKSLIEKAQEEEQAGVGRGNKALVMMMKMGFTPGQSLGRQVERQVEDPENEGLLRKSSPPPQHKTEPLPINEWMGKKGIGTTKRARSPSAHDRIVKMAKMEEESTRRSFRDRTRQEYEERKSMAKLGPAQRTCSTLDEKAGKMLNVLWLDPNKPETFPSGLMEALTLHHNQDIHVDAAGTIQDRLRKQMQADALSALTERDQEDEDGDGDIETTTLEKQKKLVEAYQEYNPDFLEEAVQFLRLQPQDRLYLVLSYLRTVYAYCFYCGMEYESQEEMATQCPGPQEDDHD